MKAPAGLTIRRFAVNSFKNKLHYHGCGTCRGRYTCSCDMPGVDLDCSRCKGGHPDDAGAAAWRPKDCCREQSRMANNADREMYKLAGPGPWWVCTHCWRQHPIDPKRNSNV